MPELKNIDECAELLRIAPVSVRRYIHSGKLPCTRIGKRYMFTTDDLELFIAANKMNRQEKPLVM